MGSIDSGDGAWAAEEGSMRKVGAFGAGFILVWNILLAA
jgi:hypothetical protein